MNKYFFKVFSKMWHFLPSKKYIGCNNDNTNKQTLDEQMFVCYNIARRTNVLIASKDGEEQKEEVDKLP